MTGESTPSHELIPSHKILPKEEGEKILAQFKASRLQIPRIKLKDPALSSKNAKPGQIVEVTRLDGSLYYRLVVN